MLGLLLVTSALLGNDPAGPSPFAPEERDSYEAALAQVGRDADAHVRLALWCEAHGLDAERVKHLSLAVLNNPAHPMARGLLGLVAFRGHWRRPDAVAAALAADADRKALIADYEQRRDRLAETADAHWKLALWCEENGLKAESVAHLWSAVRLDPAREPAWRRLGYRKQKDGRWLTEAQVAREKEEAGLQKQADKYWKPVLEKWREMLTAKDPARRAEAEAGLAGVTDPRAVPMVWAVFAAGDEARQTVAVQVLGQIDAAGASRSLAFLALFSGSAEVRRTATETLRRRDVREFAGLLVALLRDPIKYEVRHVKGPGSPGELFVQGKKSNLKRLYSPPSVPNVPLGPGSHVTYDNNGLPVVLYDEGTFNTGRIPVAQLLGSLSGLTFSSRPFAPVPLNSSQKHNLQNVISKSGLSAAQGVALEQSALANPGLLSALSWSSYGYSAPYAPQTLLPTTPNAAILQVAQEAVIRGQLGMGNGLGFTLAKEFEVPIGRMMVEARKTAVVAERQLENDVATIERYNESIVRRNQRITPILKEVSGQDLGENRESWEKWWIDQLGYTIKPQKSSAATPTIVENVPLSYQPQLVPVGDVYQVIGARRMSCFGAGTPVHTLTGTRPIETLRVGDEVLTQDLKTGALRYQPILVVHHNPPSKTFRIALGGETVVSSEFHRFWRAGQGWVMARDLKPGDTLRTLGGLARVEAVEAGAVQPVFNLDVAEDADFFVGAGGALVHDNTLPDLRQAPFDAAPSLAAVAARRD